ncbi:MAG: twin-arginine translocation protein, TatA/E family subunit [Planctomycetota bacterium]
MIFIGVVAVVLFGGNLPDVARKFGAVYRDLRKSLNDVQAQFREAEYEARRTVNEATNFDDQYADDEPEEDVASSVPTFKPPA